MSYIILFLEFFKIGLFAIGGGLATLPFLYDLTDKYDWFTKQDLSNMIAVSESTPGPIGINCATYAGVNSVGILGGAISSVGLVMPSLLIILFIAHFLNKFRENKFVNYSFEGIRPAVTAMIAVAFVDVFKTTILNSNIIEKDIDFISLVNLPSLILFVAIFFGIKKFNKLHPIIFIIFSGLIGILFKF